MFTITTQARTGGNYYPAVLYTVGNLASAKRGAQIVANARRAYTMFWKGQPSFYARRECFMPDPQIVRTSGSYWTDTARAERSEIYTTMRAYEKSCGRNVAAVLAAFRVLYKGRRLHVRPSSAGRHLVDETGGNICRVESVRAPGPCHVAVKRDYSSASVNTGKPVISGGFTVSVTVRGQTHRFMTWEGAHECSAYPVPDGERRAETLCEITLP